MKHSGASHCCKEHGCKYGCDDECSVVLGEEKQLYRQECCDVADQCLIRSLESLKRYMRKENIKSMTERDIDEEMKMLKARSHSINDY